MRGSNKHGLSRHIPADVARSIRQHCGYGCVICGLTLVEYEHFAPDFCDAAEHSVDGIALLCSNHHALVTKRLIPKEDVAAAWADPAAKRIGFSHAEHLYFKDEPKLVIGSTTFSRIFIPLRVNNVNVFEIRPAEIEGGPARISADIRNPQGGNVLLIKDNHWMVPSSNWDFQCLGNRYVFRDKYGIVLSILLEPPGIIIVEQLHTIAGNVIIDANRDRFVIGNTYMKNAAFSEGYVGISMNSQGNPFEGWD